MTLPRRALLSVTDKTGIEDFARGLERLGFELLSTGGTAGALRAAGLSVTDVSSVTEFPEMMDGRLKTLHPAIHGPILARRDVPEDMRALEKQGYRPIDLVAVNLYAFRETVSGGGVSVEKAMGKVDIGGPTMIRAAAKNHAHVWVTVDPSDYPRVLAALESKEDAGPLRRELAAKVFRHISAYDATVSEFLEPPAGAGSGKAKGEPELPDELMLTHRKIAGLRYGENPDQAAAFYVPDGHDGKARKGIASLEQHHGKELSYNNLLDLDGALLSLAAFAVSPRPAVVIVKHTTPCGLAVGETVKSAFERALRTDPVSAFGSVIAVNRTIDRTAAEAIGELFAECVVAPGVSPEAMEVLTRKKNVRILTFPVPEGDVALPPMVAVALGAFEAAVGVADDARRAARFLARHGRDPLPWAIRGIYGGLLVQTPPVPPLYGVPDPGWKVVTRRAPTPKEMEDLEFAWAVVFGVKSNAIVLARGGATLGIGAGQMSRVDSSRLAVQKAVDQGLDLRGCALASDAFFPFRDGVETAVTAGVRAVVQPGGSMRDGEVIAAADDAGIAMVFTGRRLFRH
ncbi:MAG: bifunctional phosphoribosylaminoimidazolecarboxamide formyltransferase/IMP cyclohydrolase [Gemmatimonadetes bacterium]|nr:bifunctional phosphoribosylaminoimidazolecarboxamide formyltransferase/IMP cyclohydrolase [Gemmatimonadota bacterium]